MNLMWDGSASERCKRSSVVDSDLELFSGDCYSSHTVLYLQRSRRAWVCTNLEKPLANKWLTQN